MGDLDAEMMEIAKVFFQESREGLDVMESGLLGLSDASDSETINTIFRAAHSIKGGSATFGFAEVAGFTHGVETLLDELRNGLRPVTAEAIQTLLQSCDCLREMIAAAEAGHALDQSRIAVLNADIAHILGEARAPGAPPAMATQIPAPPAAAPGAASGWRILFQPVSDLLRLRNEPTRMFAELARLGAITVSADLSRLPELDTMDPEACYLSWVIEVRGEVSRAQLDEIFDWVDPGCLLEFTPVGAVQPRFRPRRFPLRRARRPSRRRKPPPPRPNPAANPFPLESLPTSSIASSTWSGSCSSPNPCWPRSPTGSIQANSTCCARASPSWRATPVNCRRA